MNDEQLCDFYLRAKEANLTLEKINDTLKQFAANFICFHVDRAREVNVVESLLFVENKLEALADKIEELECIDRKLCAIWTQLNRIADAIETKDALGVSFKVERCFDPSDGPFESQEPEEPEGFADMA